MRHQSSEIVSNMCLKFQTTGTPVSHLPTLTFFGDITGWHFVAFLGQISSRPLPLPFTKSLIKLRVIMENVNKL